VIVECIRGWNGQGSDDVQKGLAFDIKGDVFDDNSSGYNLVFGTLIERRNAWGSTDLRERGRTTAGRKVRIVGGRQRAIVGVSGPAIKPLLPKGCIWG